MQTTYPGPKVWSSDDWDNDGIYTRLDRFGRRINLWWHGSGTNTRRYDETLYTYDYAGNRTSRDIRIRNLQGNENLTGVNVAADLRDQDYEYDGLQRLKNVDQGKADLTTHQVTSSNNFHQQWTLDQMGNWSSFMQDDNGNGSGPDLTQTRTHSAANEITAFNVPFGGVGSAWATPAHDDAGNMVSIPQPKALTNSYTATYDAWNRLVRLEDGSDDVAVYQYDGLHRRIRRQEDGNGDGSLNSSDPVTHFYYNENWQCLEERVDSSATASRQYVWHPYYIDALAITYSGGLGSKHYYCHDGNFNVTAILDGSGPSGTGTCVERYAYTPYGEVTVLDASFAPDADGKSDISNEFLYTGRRLDPGTGLYQYRHRYYHSLIGKFINRDPIGYRGGTNLYQYVKGKPIDRVDPSGLKCNWKIYEGPSHATPFSSFMGQLHETSWTTGGFPSASGYSHLYVYYFLHSELRKSAKISASASGGAWANTYFGLYDMRQEADYSPSHAEWECTDRGEIIKVKDTFRGHTSGPLFGVDSGFTETYSKSAEPSENGADNRVYGRVWAQYEVKVHREISFEIGSGITLDPGFVELPISVGTSAGLSFGSHSVTLSYPFSFECRCECQE